MFCTKCGAKCEDGEVFCGNCGASLASPVQKEPATPEQAAPEQAEQPASVQPEQNYQYNGQGQYQQGGFYAAPVQQAVPPKKKKGKKIAITIISVVLALALIVGALILIFPKQAKDLWAKAFYSDAKYFRMLAGNKVRELTGDIPEFYENVTVNEDKKPLEGKFSVSASINQELLSSLVGETGVDLGWLTDIGLDLENGGDAGNAVFTLSGKKILTAEYKKDPDTGKVILRLPELSDDYVAIDAEDVLNAVSSMRGMLPGSGEGDGIIGGMIPSLPFGNFSMVLRESAETVTEFIEPEKLEELINKYVGIFLDKIENVEKGSEKVEIEEIAQDLTTYEAELSSEELTKCINAVASELKEDKDIEKIIDDIADKAAADSSSEYNTVTPDEVKKDIYDLIDHLCGDDVVKGVIVKVKLFVNGKGEIAGVDVNYDAEGAETITITAKKVEDGGKTAFLYQFDYATPRDDRVVVAVTGSGEYEGDLFSGDAKVSALVEGENYELLKLKFDGFDTEAVKRGELEGKVTLRAGAGIGKLINKSGPTADNQFGIDGSQLQMVSMISFTFDFDRDGDRQNFKLNVGALAQNVIDVEGYYDQTEVDVDRTIPSSGVVEFDDMSDLSDWVKSWDIEGFMKSLTDAGVPADLLGNLTDIFN